MGKKGDLNYSEHGIVVIVKRASVSTSETVYLFGFSHTNISREWSENEKVSISAATFRW